MFQRANALSILIARVAIGFIFVAHGYQKIGLNGLDATVEGFEAMGVPFPEFTAALTAGIELVAGSALIVGVALPFAGMLLAATMTSALFITHWPDFWVTDGGIEFVLALAAASLMIGFSGGGAFSLDRAISSRRPKTDDNDAVSTSEDASESTPSSIS